MAIRGVVFDLGHTLMLLDSTWPEVFRRGAADLAAFVRAQDLGVDGEAFARALLDRRAEGFSRANATRREVTAQESVRWTLARFGVPDPDPSLVQGAIDAFFAYEDIQWRADPRAAAVLRDLGGRELRLGMFSNATDDPFIQRLVDRFGFREWLQPALTSAATSIRKPDPEAFAPILTAWRLPPESVVMVGDSLEADILGASLAGMRSVWLQPCDGVRQESYSGPAVATAESIVPDAIIGSLDELPDCLAGL